MDMDQSKEALRESGSDVKDAAATSAGQVKDQATEQVRSVADTAMEQTKQTASSLGHGLEYEANEQSLRIAALLDDLGGELDQMSQSGSGWAASLMGDAAGRTKDLARWMEQTEPRDMLSAVEDFARRRPGAFILGSALAGVVVGRLTRGMIAANGSSPSRPVQPTGYSDSSAFATPVVDVPFDDTNAAFDDTERVFGETRSDPFATTPGTFSAPTSVPGTGLTADPIIRSGFEEAPR
jgi:hypothetical protein